jgi:RNA polymerase sigma-70 factor (ECF subfamily)
MHFAVAALAEDHRQVIELAYYQGLSQSEIAETLCWPLGTVKTRLRAAMEQLRRSWGEK